MQPIDLFTLVDSHRKKDQKMLISREDTPFAIDVDGLSVNAQFQVDGNLFLVLLTDNSPFDEMLHVYLIKSEGMIEDSVEAGSRFGLGPGGVLRITEFGNNWIEFNFFSGDTLYRLEISSQERRIRHLPYCWRYKNILKRHVIVVTEIQKEND